MKYTPGLMVGQLSGKAGSTVASRNRGGSYFRTRVIPKLVRNAKTTAVRSSFTSFSQRYRLLTDAQREGWAALGSSTPRKNSLGEVFHLSGLQMFVQANQNLDTIGVAGIDDAPPQVTGGPVAPFLPIFTSGAPVSTTVVAGANSITQNVASTADMYDGASLFFATAGVYRTVTSITDGTHVVLDAPVLSTTAEVVDLTTLPTMTVELHVSPLQASDDLLVFATAPLSAGVARPSKSAFRLVTNAGAAATSPVDFALKYFQTFGNPAPGQKVFVRFKTVNNATGLSGSESDLVGTVG